MTRHGFENLVHRHQDRVFGFAFYLLRSREEAEDVAQEVLVRFWHHRDEVDEDRLTGWLLRVTRNACIDAMRRRRAYRKVVDTDGERVEMAAGMGRSPDALAETTLFNEHLRRALDALDEPYRSIVILREIQEMKYDEIAEILSLPLNTVKVYLHRARKRLREHLGDVWRPTTA